MDASPDTRSLIETLRFVGGLLDTDVAYVLDGRFHFRLDSRWSLALSPHDAGRFRLDACTGGEVRASMWAKAEDRDRLAALVLAARAEASALAKSLG
jgi:hypothetical protein